MSRVEELENEIKGLENRKIELLKELKLEKQKTEIEYSFKNSEKYFVLGQDGCISDYLWDGSNFDKKRYSQGNTFKTKQEVYKERDKRELLMRFKQFRDKCNGDWKPDFSQLQDDKYSIQFNYNFGTLTIYNVGCLDDFRLFGYFKELKDAERAIELFGDEIKRLFVEEYK